MTINERVSPETLDKIIEAADEVITALAGTNEDVHKNDSAKMCQLWDDLNDRYATPAIVKALATEIKQYRAAAEPVAWVMKDDLADTDIISTPAYLSLPDAVTKTVGTLIPLYAAPQVTSVPELKIRKECPWCDGGGFVEVDHGPSMGIEVKECRHCRAAMLAAPAVQAEQLSGNAEQVSQPVLPEPITRNDADGWWMYKGRRVGGGCAEWYNRALDDCRAAIASGKSPAIPDGYALVPVKPTQAMIDAHVEGVQSGGIQKGYRAMLAAAPQQEAE